MRIYLASYRFSRPSVISVGVDRQTEKSYMPEKNTLKYEVNEGYFYIGKRVSKDAHNVFTSLTDALIYIEELAHEKVSKAKRNLQEAEEVISYCKDIIDNLNGE